jgi:hypothetical protein
VANSQEDDIAEQAQHPDLLAAVVLHVLVSEGQQGISLEQVARTCERDPSDEAERQEVQVALEILVRDELAIDDADGTGQARYTPTRAAIRAAELSF